MPNVLSPNPIEFKGLNPMKKVYEKQKQELAGVPSSGKENSINIFTSMINFLLFFQKIIQLLLKYVDGLYSLSWKLPNVTFFKIIML